MKDLSRVCSLHSAPGSPAIAKSASRSTSSRRTVVKTGHGDLLRSKRGGKDRSLIEAIPVLPPVSSLSGSRGKRFDLIEAFAKTAEKLFAYPRLLVSAQVRRPGEAVQFELPAHCDPLDDEVI